MEDNNVLFKCGCSILQVVMCWKREDIAQLLKAQLFITECVEISKMSSLAAAKQHRTLLMLHWENIVWLFIAKYTKCVFSWRTSRGGFFFFFFSAVWSESRKTFPRPWIVMDHLQIPPCCLLLFICSVWGLLACDRYASYCAHSEMPSEGLVNSTANHLSTYLPCLLQPTLSLPFSTSTFFFFFFAECLPLES